MTASIRVVTVTYNSSDVLGDFLASLSEASSSPFEVTVVDNASQDAEASRTIAEAHGARFIALEDNLGYGSAMNRGVAAGPSADFLMLANPDLTLAPGAVDALLAAAEVDPRSGALGPAIHNLDGSLYPSGRPLPSLRTGVGHALFSRSWPTNPWTRAYRTTLGAGRPTPVGWLSGACLFVRGDVYAQLNGFDERYFMYFEDVDLGRRIGLAGFQNVYVPQARATHHGGHSTSSEPGPMEQAHHESAYRYLAEVYSGPLFLPLRAALRAGLRLRARGFSRPPR
ncbi:glycosyl transferase [Leifsonia sp. LS1]|uniref:glycosyltransferase family 2 protein n=1 Tax=Leifsonia sp. LS1 TaxID=2828483 RepID=UPI001CFE72B9|nr:glycosyltransferase family 2 protein [Leifsonia sp. LS1]GIT81017.1 glycosyl transferase [Leifsonia sp. LS1]